jgi:flagella basal body P-ring formation protein FlgA
MRQRNIFYCMWLVLIMVCVLITTSGAAQSLADAIRDRLAVELKKSIPGDVELQEISFLNAPSLPPLHGFVITDVVQSGYSGKNRVTYLVTVKHPAGRSFSLLAEVSYDVLVDVFVTSRTLLKGDQITENDYYRVRQKSSRIAPGTIVSADEFNGKTVKMSLAEGLVLRRDHLLSGEQVKRGQKVRIEIQSGAIVVTAQGVLRHGGSVGSSVRVYCESSRRELQGILVAPDTVRVKS